MYSFSQVKIGYVCEFHTLFPMFLCFPILTCNCSELYEKWFDLSSFSAQLQFHYNESLCKFQIIYSSKLCQFISFPGRVLWSALFYFYDKNPPKQILHFYLRGIIIIHILLIICFSKLTSTLAEFLFCFLYFFLFCCRCWIKTCCMHVIKNTFLNFMFLI